MVIRNSQEDTGVKLEQLEPVGATVGEAFGEEVAEFFDFAHKLVLCKCLLRLWNNIALSPFAWPTWVFPLVVRLSQQLTADVECKLLESAGVTIGEVFGESDGEATREILDFAHELVSLIRRRKL